MKTIRLIAPFIATFLLITFVALAMPKQRITIKGSDTMVILVQRWSELYPDKTNTEFQVTGGGSGTGIAALINGTTDICSSSRPIKKDEVAQLEKKFGYKGLEIRVAMDGLAVYVHKSNPVKQLTMAQIKDIFTGKVTNWKDVGGANKPILLYSRENNSGTYEFFKEHVLLKQDFASNAQHMAGTAALINAVSKDPNSIGFGGAAYAKNVKAVAVAKDASSKGVLPNDASIHSGEYPISRFLYFYLNQKPAGNVKKFIDWVISPAGQKIVTEVGYYPIKRK
ncbi:MAG: phosphate ABC transporter substrate-binding protein [Ignavibacteria bacterium]|nr:phosphate ABC transporter substrate-binding protein [Ignavibacteria bacterium]MBP6510960.1 phosphate ABC transporter substrate-binding protein [Candidatus Kapabacteria bacterium]MBK6420136.1 phosphate ABC transporter substrate-binding protein [Ignavibacteria bacterium]MBK6759229.1 phosphate ABC transporter substrate-binding protein [Ignavibacteria bacterium]MBK7034332.1 phosphate ABC transporter substrate-binding protein [Ignavibacteria bacterium]